MNTSRIAPLGALAILLLATWGATQSLSGYLLTLTAIIAINVMLAVSLSLTVIVTSGKPSPPL